MSVSQDYYDCGGIPPTPGVQMGEENVRGPILTTGCRLASDDGCVTPHRLLTDRRFNHEGQPHLGAPPDCAIGVPEADLNRRSPRNDVPSNIARPPAIFTGIPSDMVDEFWDRVSPVLWRCIIRTDGRHTLITTKHAIQDNRMQLWAAFSDPEMTTCTAALVTETLTYPSGEQECEILFCAGDVIPGCLPLLSQIESWAKSVGCKGMRLHGRRGWAKILPTYEESSVVLRKAL